MPPKYATRSTIGYEHHPARVFAPLDGGGPATSLSLLERLREALFNTTRNVRGTAEYLEDDVEPGEEVSSRPPPKANQVTWGPNMTRTMSKFGKSSKITEEINYLKGL